jgi:L-ascorbate metabolism protein UlaG (beta-lactamase superfamily)
MHPLKRPAPVLLAYLAWQGVKDSLKPVRKSYGEKIVIRPDELRVWVLGHSTLLINFFGTTILTDPVLRRWATFAPRHTAASHTPGQLPWIDYIVLSHAHHDHWNIKTLKMLAPQTSTIIVPKNCADLLLDIDFKNILEIDWGEETRIEPLTFRAFKPIHWGERYPWQQRRRGFNSYIIQKNGTSIFFCGDSAYGDFFKEVGAANKIDLALLPIGAYTPKKLQKSHMGPYDAWRAFEDLRANHLIPMHWGSFRLSREAPEEPPLILAKLARRANRKKHVHILRNGQSQKFVLNK